MKVENKQNFVVKCRNFLIKSLLKYYFIWNNIRKSLKKNSTYISISCCLKDSKNNSIKGLKTKS